MLYPRTPRAAVALLALTIAVVSAIVPLTSALGDTARAHASRTLDVTDTAHLTCNYNRSEGSTLVEEGNATGQLPGTMTARVNISQGLSGTFTVRPKGGGTITGHGSAAVKQPPRRYESFSGSLTVSGGSGRYAHARGRAGLYGVYDRRTCKLTVQTTGRLTF